MKALLMLVGFLKTPAKLFPMRTASHPHGHLGEFTSSTVHVRLTSSKSYLMFWETEQWKIISHCGSYAVHACRSLWSMEILFQETLHWKGD